MGRSILLIKIFEWHGVGQEAIAFTNNEVGNIVGTDRVIVYLYRSIKVHLYAIRDDEVLTCGIHSTFPQLTPDQLCLSALILYIATKEKKSCKQTLTAKECTVTHMIKLASYSS